MDHVNHVKTVIAEKHRPADENSCPKCGKTMVLRTSRKGSNQGGQFWGCSGYPKCKTVRQVL
jgi:ssDNA-binding Zn-finger/Zn-ribbon topoisomerase 1